MNKIRKAICCIAKDEDNYIDEWIQYHWNMGFDDIFVFQHDWKYAGNFAKMPDTSTQRLHLIDINGPCMQLPAYNHWLKFFSLEYDWVAFLDVDEFICLRGTNSLEHILDTFRDVPSIAVNWRMFGDSGRERKPDDGDWSLLRRFTHCAKDLNHHVKQIVNLKRCRELGLVVTMINPHCSNITSVSMTGKRFYGPFNEHDLNVTHVMELNHYFCKTREEFVDKIERGRADTETKREDGDELFVEHNRNEVENTVALDFFNATQYANHVGLPLTR